MAPFPCFTIISLILLLLISLPSAFSLTEDSDSDSDSSSPLPGSDMVECGPRLLPLVPCAPFVQGSVSTPAQTCCDNLMDIYNQHPNCLCSLINDTTFTSFPINKTLALQLPLLCNLALSSSTCPGLNSIPVSPEPQISNGTNASSSTAVSPTVSLPPRLNMGFGFNRNAAAKLKTEGTSSILVTAAFLLIEVFDRF